MFLLSQNIANSTVLTMSHSMPPRLAIYHKGDRKVNLNCDLSVGLRATLIEINET